MPTHRLFYLAICSFYLAARPVQAADPESTKESSFLDNINWTKGPAKAELKSLAEVQVPEGFMFTGAKGTQKLLEAMGNPTSGSELGFLAPTSLVWFVVFEFADVGFVKDDDKDKLDADKLLKSIKEGTEAANKYREKMGAPFKLIVREGKDHGWKEMADDMKIFADWFDEHLRGLKTNK